MMNKITFFLTVTLASLLVTTYSAGQGRFSIAPTLSPSYRHLNWTSQLGNGGGARGSQSMTGLSAGLTVSYTFTPTLSLSAGILYNRSSGDFHYDNYTNVATQAWRNENWQLPLLLNYTSSTRHLSPYFSAGLLANHTYLTTNLNTMVSTHHTIDEGTVFTFSLYGMVGAGVQYRVTPKLAVIVQPTAAYRLNAPSGDYPISYTRWNEYLYGLQTQLKFTL